nr:MAG TPA: B-ZIP transcription factor [Caudoviricetes sp.]
MSKPTNTIYSKDFAILKIKTLEKENKKLKNIIKEVREEIRMLESNCDISDYQAQKLYHLLDKGE